MEFEIFYSTVPFDNCGQINYISSILSLLFLIKGKVSFALSKVKECLS